MRRSHRRSRAQEVRLAVALFALTVCLLSLGYLIPHPRQQNQIASLRSDLATTRTELRKVSKQASTQRRALAHQNARLRSQMKVLIRLLRVNGVEVPSTVVESSQSTPSAPSAVQPERSPNPKSRPSGAPKPKPHPKPKPKPSPQPQPNPQPNPHLVCALDICVG